MAENKAFLMSDIISTLQTVCWFGAEQWSLVKAVVPKQLWMSVRVSSHYIWASVIADCHWKGLLWPPRFSPSISNCALFAPSFDLSPSFAQLQSEQLSFAEPDDLPLTWLVAPSQRMG